MKSGAKLIADERKRQVAKEKYTSYHDDCHTIGQLAKAAICYAEEAVYSNEHHLDRWPWGWEHWKPSNEPVRNLVKAGALIAAEIDRLQRKAKQYNLKADCSDVCLREQLRRTREAIRKAK